MAAVVPRHQRAGSQGLAGASEGIVSLTHLGRDNTMQAQRWCSGGGRRQRRLFQCDQFGPAFVVVIGLFSAYGPSFSLASAFCLLAGHDGALICCDAIKGKRSLANFRSRGKFQYQTAKHKQIRDLSPRRGECKKYSQNVARAKGNFIHYC